MFNSKLFPGLFEDIVNEKIGIEDRHDLGLPSSKSLGVCLGRDWVYAASALQNMCCYYKSAQTTSMDIIRDCMCKMSLMHSPKDTVMFNKDTLHVGGLYVLVEWVSAILK